MRLAVCMPQVPFERGGSRTLNIFLVRIGSENWNVDLFSERGELLNRGRSLQIAGDQRWGTSFFFKQPRQLGG